MQKKFLSGLTVIAGMSLLLFGCGNSDSDNGTPAPTESGVAPGDSITIEKSLYSNPVTGFDNDGNIVYGGDPAAMVDGDTVYLYTGHDTASYEAYVIPEYLCYSTKDMLNWTYEGVVMSISDVSWASDKNSAWAAQTVKHYDEASGKDRYYMYFCTWDKTSEGKQSIGVAVSDSPTGPFEDIGEPLVPGTFTTGESSAWNDIDPTVWIETDENGEEHRYLAWGNGKFYVCELNEDMISIKDIDGDGEIVFGTDVVNRMTPEAFTEAPWLYRRQDENGNYYGVYYLFYAHSWREQMAYATMEDLWTGFVETRDVIMKRSATSNTNHMSVIDFNGKTYFIYHNGVLDKGSGFRRVVCIEEITFNDDGSINYIPETTTGIAGTSTTIKTSDDKLISHEHFTNSASDDAYPYKNIAVGANLSDDSEDASWVMLSGKTDKYNDNYVSIASDNKPGLYLTVADGKVVLSHDSAGNLADSQTFKTVQGLSGDGVSFESVLEPGMYITVDGNELTLTDGSDKDACSFILESK